MTPRGGIYGDLHGDGQAVQDGPLMVRHVIDGHEVLLPADAKLHKPLKPGDAIDDHPLGGTY